MCLRVELIEPLEQLVILFQAGKGLIEVTQQPLSPLHLIDSQPTGERNTTNRERLSGLRRVAGVKRSVLNSQVSRALITVGNCHKGRQVRGLGKFTCEDGAIAGVFQRGERLVPGIDVFLSQPMGTKRMRDAAQDHEAIGTAGQFWQVLTDLNTRALCLDRIEGATKL